MGGTIHMGRKVVGCHYDADRRRCGRHARGRGQATVTRSQAEHVISSAPMRQLAHGLTPPLSDEARRRRPTRCKYRDFLTVVLILKDRNQFNDNWIYIHDPEREGGPRPELQVVVAGDGARPGAELLRPGILLLRGRRPVDRPPTTI